LAQEARSASDKWNEEVRPLLFSKIVSNSLFTTRERICFKTEQSFEVSKLFQF
jgi:hypothetical protein